MKQRISSHRGGPEDKIVGSEVVSLWQPFRGPACNPPLFHPVDERWLATMGWLSSSGHLEGYCQLHFDCITPLILGQFAGKFSTQELYSCIDLCE